MRKIVRLDMASALKIFAAFYALIGLYVSCKAAITGEESVQCPFGFAYPLTTFYLYLTVHLPYPATAITFGIILIDIVFYAITGLISGAAVVFVYNWLARFWPLLSGEIQSEAQSTPVETKPSITPVPQIAHGNQESGDVSSSML